MLIGHGAFTAQAAVARVRARAEARRAGRSARWRSPGVRAIVLSSLPAGIGVGSCEVGLPAFADAEGARELAGVLLAVWSLGSAAGGLRLRRAGRAGRSLRRVHLAVAALLPLGCLPLAAAPSVAVMALLVLPAGMFIAPLLATRNELIGGSRRPARATEAYTWPVTAFVGGIAVGSAMAGALVEGRGGGSPSSSPPAPPRRRADRGRAPRHAGPAGRGLAAPTPPYRK